MKWLYRHLYKKEKGFTLVELMIVIIILAILTGIAIPSYLVLRNRARTEAARSEMKNIGTALEMHNADLDAYPLTGVYPGALEAPTAYMVDVPVNDPWGVPYVYVSAGTTYTLECLGQDGGQGVDDIMIQDGAFIPFGTAPNT